MWLPSPTHTRLGETWEGRAHVTDEGILHLDPQTLGVGSQVIDAVTHTLFPRVLRVGQQQQPKVLRREVHFRTQPHLHVLGRLGAGTVLLKNVVRFLLDLAHSRQDFHGQDVTGGEPHRQRATPADNDGRSNNAKHYHDSFGRGHEADFTDVLVVADHNFTLLVDDWIDRESIFIRKKWGFNCHDTSSRWEGNNSARDVSVAYCRWAANFFPCTSSSCCPHWQPWT